MTSPRRESRHGTLRAQRHKDHVPLDALRHRRIMEASAHVDRLAPQEILREIRAEQLRPMPRHHAPDVRRVRVVARDPVTAAVVVPGRHTRKVQTGWVPRWEETCERGRVLLGPGLPDGGAVLSKLVQLAGPAHDVVGVVVVVHDKDQAAADEAGP